MIIRQLGGDSLEVMDTALSYLISIGLIAFGVWIVAAKAASGSLLVWTFVGLIPVVVGLFRLFSGIRNDKAP
jgi:hypothetical protein